jgi:hypothetical protein
MVAAAPRGIQAGPHRGRCLVSPAKTTLSRPERLALDPTIAQHGVISTYRNWGCRCKPCVNANTLAVAAARKVYRERLQADPYVVTHGLNSTYVNWGCRCRPCRDAHADAGRV